ncbi:MAG: TldD/PmbA family protein [Chloroflexia bacterium]
MDFDRLTVTLPQIVSLLESKMPYASVEAIVGDGLRIKANNQEQDVSPGTRNAGVVLTVHNGLYLEEYSTTQMEREPLLAEARAWLDTLTRHRNGAEPDPGPEGDHEYNTPCGVDPDSVSLAEKFERVVERQARARALDPRIANAEVAYVESTYRMLFAGRHRVLSQRLVRTRIVTQLAVRDDAGTMQYEWDIQGGSMGHELWDDVDRVRPLEDVCEVAVRLLSAERIPGGSYECVTAPDVSGTVAHESFGHGVETDMFLKGRARAEDYLGKRVAPDYVNMLDDPTLQGAFGAYFFDDEGQIAAPTYIIRDGIFERGISDLYSSLKLDILRTGNGRRESFARKAYARMSNTFFARGRTPVEEMIAGVEDGIYLGQLRSGMEDPKNWGIQLVMHYGKEIKNGKLTGRIFSPVSMTGSVLDVLASISQVGDDFIMDTGYCGKGHKEYIEVSAGGPHLRLRATLS